MLTPCKAVSEPPIVFMVPLAGVEPAHMVSKTTALSTELQRHFSYSVIKVHSAMYAPFAFRPTRYIIDSPRRTANKSLSFLICLPSLVVSLERFELSSMV